MQRSRAIRRGPAIGLALLAAALLPIALGGGSSPAAERARPTVLVVDDVYDPAFLKIEKGTKVRFRWSAANVNEHDVSLADGPRRADASDFQSEVTDTDYRFSPRFRKRGTYKLICHLHSDTMKMTVKVKRRASR